MGIRLYGSTITLLIQLNELDSSTHSVNFVLSSRVMSKIDGLKDNVLYSSCIKT
jgi:hypothetical protein